MDQPLACSLGPADQRTRRETIDRLAHDSLLGKEHIEGGARLTFARGKTTESRLRALIAAEAECCSFLRMELTDQGDALTLDVTGSADAQPVIAEFFA
jgi:hypothetical protein